MSPSARSLDLARKEDFFSDPFFSDLLKEKDDVFQNRLSLFKDKNLVPASKQEAAHNLQVSCSNDQFLIQLELPGFQPEDFSLKTRDDIIILEAESSGTSTDGATCRKYTKEFKMPQGVCREQISSAYTPEGVLTISAPRVLEAPEGATISEAMTAGSQAYTTEDGTKVAQDSQASSQMIAASTQSEDGSSKSSMSYSSSSSSSSTMTSSSNMGGNLGNFPSIGMSGGMSGDMDDMMKNMMSKMDMGGPTGGSLMSKMTGSSMMSSSSVMQSFSSSSSSSSSTMESSSLGGGFPSLKMQMPSSMFNIEELSTAGTEASGPPAYTVSSPTPSSEEMSHSVKGTGAKTHKDDKVDASILLKLKEGDEYKLVLNMQQFSPENILVKLNDDRELTITAQDGTTEQFSQKHAIPQGIDLDKLTSSFSSDGILVIRAPKM